MRKGQKARPFDEAAAIQRAARCRALRERAGLTLDQLADRAGVTLRSVSRWESWDGRGSCPDDVLDLLESLIDHQADIIAEAVDVAGGLLESRGIGSDPCQADGAPDGSESGSETDAPGAGACIRQGGGDALNRAADPGLVQGGDRGRNDGPPKSISMPGGVGAAPAAGAAVDALDAITVRLPYYSSQHAFELCHPNESGLHGVANANARAIAQELERLGFIVEWRFAEPDNIDGFEIRTI